MKKLLFIGLVALISSTSAQTGKPEATSFSGKALYSTPADPNAIQRTDSVIEVIRKKGNLSETDYIDIGRFLVATNRFRMSLDNYSEGLKKYPNSYKLYRYRGHRYINLRELDNAIKDLNKAEKLIRTEPKTWEVDAQGNKTATYQHNIWYHIGLYHFLKKNYAKSAEAFEKSLAATEEKNDGRNKAGASDWLYNAYMRMGEKAKAEKVLEPITLDYDIDDKTYPYYRRLLLFKGLIKPEAIVDANLPTDKMSVTDITKLYGLSVWYRYQGNESMANELCAKVLQSNSWQGFAYACAEIDTKK